MKSRFSYQPATTVSMIQSGPEGAYFGVFRARVRIRESNFADWTWNIHKATPIGTIFVPKGEPCPTYREMAAQFETPDFPAWRQ